MTRDPATFLNCKVTRVDRIEAKHLHPGALNVIVFGPGKGEAILVRFPDGRVAVVDGCREPKHPKTGRGDPVREFLADLASDPAAPVKFMFVALTHPHDDHYAGFGRLVEAYQTQIEKLWIVEPSTGRYHSEYLTYLDVTRAPPTVADDDEPAGLQRVIAAVDAFREKRPQDYHELQSRADLHSAIVKGHQLTVKAWAPSANDMRNARDDLVRATKAALASKDVPAHDPNTTSAAVGIRWGDAGVLLAGDLLCEFESEGGKYIGWTGAHDCAHPVQVVNVAHHASKEAHDEQLWKKLGAKLAIVTPFQNAQNNQPPRQEQIQELAKTCAVAITSPPAWGKSSGVTMDKAQKLRNAVGVALDAKGNLLEVLLAGEADWYE